MAGGPSLAMYEGYVDMALDSADGRIYVAASLPGLNGTGYLARGDVGGSSWTMMTGAPDLGSLAADPFAPGTLLATTKLDGLLVRSTDSAATWTSIASHPGGTLAFDPARPGHYLLNLVNAKGIAWSNDSGATWSTSLSRQELDAAHPSMMVMSRAPPLVFSPSSPSVVYAAVDGMILRSVTGGQ